MFPVGDPTRIHRPPCSLCGGERNFVTDGRALIGLIPTLGVALMCPRCDSRYFGEGRPEGSIRALATEIREARPEHFNCRCVFPQVGPVENPDPDSR